MSRDNSPSADRRREYFAEYCQDQTIASSEEVILQHPPEKKKKKKSRGNCRLQRIRAKLRKQGLCSEDIALLIASENNPQRLVTTDQIQQNTTKRKRNKVSKPTVTTSVSEISLMQPDKKRSRVTMAATTTTTDVEVMMTLSKKTPNYLRINDKMFKKMLSTALQGIDETTISTLLDTSEKLQYARTYAQLVDDIFYLKMKDDYWKYYHTTIMSESNIQGHNLNKRQFVRKENVLKQQQITSERLQQIEQQLNEHQQQAVNNNISTERTRLSTIIPAFVRQGQHKLSADFERKKLLLQYDVTDHCLVNTFYNLKPSEDQV